MLMKSLKLQKKNELLEQGIRVRVWRLFPRSIMTLFGKFTYDRTALIPCTNDDAEKLSLIRPEKLIFPLDEVLGVTLLPFKISVGAMLEIAYWVQEIPSYEAARRAIQRNTPIRVNDDTIRSVANLIGKMVFEEDQKRAGKTWSLLQSRQLSFPKTKKDHVLYIETDGSMLHTRIKNKDDKTNNSDKKSNWMENKLGLVFSSDNLLVRYDKNKENIILLQKKDIYVI
jgi:hypothetical protein